MRRSLFHIALFSVIVAGLAACAQDDLTSPRPSAGKKDPMIIVKNPNWNLNDFVGITAGNGFTCALKRNQQVYCWGIDNANQTGAASGTVCASGQHCVPRPTLVVDPNSKSAIPALQIDAGNVHACARLASGTATCWGNNTSGQVGTPNNLLGPTAPVAVVGGIVFTSLSAGGQSTCGTTASNGVMCWGDINGAAAPATIWGTTAASAYYTGVATGNEHFCVMDYLVGAAAVDCWGVNNLGQLGNNLSSPAPFSQSSFGSTVGRVTTEGSFTCVDQTSGVVQCTGDNTFGTLGISVSGVSTSTSIPQTVGWNVFRHAWTTLQGASTSPFHGCALDQNANAWCWGDNNTGQLGYSTGSYLISGSPWPVTGGIVFRAVAAGYQHTCGIGTDNHIYCWGSNANGELGTGVTQGGWVNSPLQAIDP